MSCKYNNCKHCGYKSECEIYKENAGLEEENRKLILGNKSLSEKLINVTREKLDLQKENAELKADLDEKENTVHTLDVLHKEAVRKYGEVNDQLTKAKELLNEFVHHYKAKTIYIENMQDLLEQAEQFLKDNEVEK